MHYADKRACGSGSGEQTVCYVVAFVTDRCLACSCWMCCWSCTVVPGSVVSSVVLVVALSVASWLREMLWHMVPDMMMVALCVLSMEVSCLKLCVMLLLGLRPSGLDTDFDVRTIACEVDNKAA